jgi:hypothetical protein
VLQRLARLGQQSRVLHCNYRLRGEILQQRDLLIGERPDFLSCCDNAAEEGLLPTQRHEHHRANFGDLDAGLQDRLGRRPR